MYMKILWSEFNRDFRWEKLAEICTRDDEVFLHSRNWLQAHAVGRDSHQSASSVPTSSRLGCFWRKSSHTFFTVMVCV